MPHGSTTCNPFSMPSKAKLHSPHLDAYNHDAKTIDSSWTMSCHTMFPPSKLSLSKVSACTSRCLFYLKSQTTVPLTLSLLWFTKLPKFNMPNTTNRTIVLSSGPISPHQALLHGSTGMTSSPGPISNQIQCACRNPSACGSPCTTRTSFGNGKSVQSLITCFITWTDNGGPLHQSNGTQHTLDTPITPAQLQCPPPQSLWHQYYFHTKSTYLCLFTQ